jgi:hypothetical protein
MAAQIYAAPSHIKVPNFNWEDINQYEKDCDKFKADLKEFCVNRCKAAGQSTLHIGEVIKFPVADGYAEYLVASLKPIQLIHIPIWDAWEFQYAKNLTKKDIIEKIEQQKSLDKLFGR